MNLKTEVIVEDDFFKLTLHRPLLVLGSCFSEHIGNRLKAMKLPVVLNPTGVLYNPFSIANALVAVAEGRTYTADDLFFFSGEWHSWDHHSVFSSDDKEVCLAQINRSIQMAHRQLRHDTVLFLTFGTAYVYRLRENGRVVANCHKFPERNFLRRRLTVEEIVQCYDRLIDDLQKRCPGISIVFTVSPIRHWKDGAHENQLSKSVLLLAVDELKHRYDCVRYFPSYEIVMDELRDYRFYADDMLHVAPLAIDYIWEKFGKALFHVSLLDFQQKYEKLRNAMNHRPFRPDSDGYCRFLQQNLHYIEELSHEYPTISFEEEKCFFTSRLKERGNTLLKVASDADR